MTAALNFNQLQEHVQTIHDGCKCLVNHQPINDKNKLNLSIQTLTDALLEVNTAFYLTGDIETRLYQIFNDPMILNTGKSLVAASRALYQVHKICELRNHFFDLLKNLPQDEKTIFESFVIAHKNTIKHLQKQYKVDLDQSPRPLRGIVQRLESIAYRVE